MGLEHTVGVVPEIFMIFVATKERPQVFAVQGGTIEKYKQKWLDAVEKYYTEVLPAQKLAEMDLEVVNGDSEQD